MVGLGGLLAAMRIHNAIIEVKQCSVTTGYANAEIVQIYSICVERSYCSLDIQEYSFPLKHLLFHLLYL